MKKLNSAAEIIAKICEILHWIGSISLAVMLVFTFVPGDPMSGTLVQGSVSVYAFEMTVTDPQGEISMAALRLFFTGGTLILGLMAMVFRNVYLILRTARGKTKFSEGVTPFQKENVRMVREIGIFFLTIHVVGFVVESIAVGILGPDNVEVSLGLGNLMVGILMLCLSQVFAQGEQLQKETEGLV